MAKKLEGINNLQTVENNYFNFCMINNLDMGKSDSFNKFELSLCQTVSNKIKQEILNAYK